MEQTQVTADVSHFSNTHTEESVSQVPQRQNGCEYWGRKVESVRVKQDSDVLWVGLRTSRAHTRENSPG